MGNLFKDITIDLDAIFFLLHIIGGVFILFLLKWFFPLLGTGKKSLDASSRWSADLKPTVGGILFFIALLLMYPFSGLHARGMGIELTGLLVASAIVFAVGLWDDIARISPKRKLAGQFIAAVVFVSFNNSMHFCSDLFGVESVLTQIPDFLFTVFLAIAMMNSVNMMDNMDAASAVSVFPSVLLLGCYSLIGATYSFDFLIAALIAFLILNWNPSRIFMGDSGSMVLGLIVAFAMLSVPSSNPEIPANSWVDLVVSIFTLGTVLIADTALVIYQRRRHDISPMQGGRDHTTHHLFYTGLSQREIAVMLFFLSFIPMIIQSVTVKLMGLEFHLISPFWRIAPLAVYFILYLTAMILISNRNLRIGKYSYTK
ncbi:MAG: MraY family glycosyltransferase [Flavobacteriales bacterium]